MRRIALLMIFGLAAAPLAMAGPQPAIYYLEDGASPLDPGVLDAEAPDGNESSLRLVTVGADGPSVWFEAGPAKTDRLMGPLIVALWPDQSAVPQGNLTASLWIIDGEERTQIARASLDVAVDPESLPDPLSLVPPDPTDPEGAALHIAGQLMPLLLHPPMVYDLGRIDVAVPANATIALGLELEDGDLPAFGASIIKYDAKPTPSFVYAPWYEAAPASTTSTSTSGSPGGSGGSGGSGSSGSGSGSSSSSSDSGSQSGSSTSEAPSEDSPGIGLLAALAAVAAAFVLRRR